MCNELGEVSHKAYKIGIQLGIPRNKMMEFQQEGDLLSAAVDYWLSGSVPDVPVTWESVVEALESKFVGEPGCASTIRTKYCSYETSTEKGPTCNVTGSYLDL